MPIDQRLQSLRRKHAELEERIREAGHRAGADEAGLKRLKLQKLRLKEEIERLSRGGAGLRAATTTPAMGGSTTPHRQASAALMDGVAMPPALGEALDGLRRRHAELDERIRAAHQRPFADGAELRRMKLEKLRLKEALEGIARTPM